MGATLYDQIRKDGYIIVDRVAAATIGLNESIVLRQVMSLMETRRAKKKNDGRYWVPNTWGEWEKAIFPFWSTSTIKRTFNSLKDMGLVEWYEEYHEGTKAIKTQWFIANIEQMQKIECEPLDGEVDNGQPPVQVDPTPSSERPDPQFKLTRPPVQNDPTQDSTKTQEDTKKTKNSSPPEKPADGRENGTPPDDPTPDAVTASQETDTDGETDEPSETETPSEITWQHAVAFYHDWRTEDGALDTNHRLANTYLSFFGGRSKKGDWKDFRFESGDWTTPDMLAGFRLWYKTYQTKQGLPDSAIPTSPQSINSWGLRYLSLSAKNLRAWNEKGAQRLRAEVYGEHDTDAYEAENAVPENYNPYTA